MAWGGFKLPGVNSLGVYSRNRYGSGGNVSLAFQCLHIWNLEMGQGEMFPRPFQCLYIWNLSQMLGMADI